MDQKTADENDFEVGDTVEVLTQQEPREFTISGIARFGTADSPAGATIALFDLPTAQELLAEPGKVDNIAVVAEEGVSEVQLADALRAALPTDQQTRGHHRRRAHRGEPGRRRHPARLLHHVPAACSP